MAKARKKQVLGRGLSALLSDNENDHVSVDAIKTTDIVGKIVDLDIDSIEVNPYQPRTKFNDEALAELANSIKELGIIQPITVRKLDEDGKFQLVSGERRFRASKLIGLEKIPAFVRVANDQESLEMALVENIQRQDLDPIEIALSYQRLIEEINITQEKLSDRVGKKRSTIANYLRLLKLDPIIQTGMRDGFMGMGHGRALINVEKKKDQLAIYERIIAHGLSVRATEELVRNYKLESPPTKNIAAKKPPTEPDFVSEGLDNMRDYLGSKVTVSGNSKGKGRIVIPFHSQEEFRRLKKILSGV